MFKLSLPTTLSRLNIRIGTKLAITVGVGVVLVTGMVVNQQLSNASIALQAEIARGEQLTATDLLHAGVALQRMQIGTREIRLSISEREAEKAMAELRARAEGAIEYLKLAAQWTLQQENRERLKMLVVRANDYVSAATEMLKEKSHYADIAKPLQQANKIGAEIDDLIEKSTSIAGTLAAQRMVEAATQMNKASQINVGFGLFVVIILIGAAIFGILSIGRPVHHIAGVLLQLANGKREVEIPYTGRGDEVGDTARAARTFRDNLVRLEKLEAKQKEAEACAMAERKDIVHKFADEFEAAVGSIVNTVSVSATKLEATANTLMETAETAHRLTSAVASSSEHASANVQSVASATEEMSASIHEIARHVEESSRIAGEAVMQAEKTDASVAELSQAASHIGEVVKLITTIAGQTNLLALNATIEAARAGEAGKGFAVVAKEVKALASQTTKAAEDIGVQISGMQAVTRDSVTAIKDIGATIRKISEIATMIAAQVEEQGAGNKEIAHNVHQAAQGTAYVAADITTVSRGAGETEAASTQVLSSAQSLSLESNRLKIAVEKFMTAVRAA
jgi:methyl-accepting chemotaxis protein